MSFIRGIEDGEATGRAREFFDEDLQKDGYVWNATRVLAQRPGVVDGWRALASAIRTGMELRRYELATLAAAKAVRGSYCALAHGKILRDQFYGAEKVTAMAQDPRTAGLDPADVALMEFAGKVAREADQVTAADVERLKAHGFSDGDVLDIALAAAARAFYSKLLDAVGIQPDAAYRKLEPAFRDALTVGRPIADGVGR